MTEPRRAHCSSHARRLRPPGLRSLFAVAALAAAGCVEEPVTSPDAIPDPSFNRASAPGQQRLAGVDAEFARIARDAPGFGGMFYGPDGRLNVYLTDDGRSPVAQRRILNRVSASLRAHEREVPSAANVTIHRGERDYVELTSLRSRISPVLREPGVAFLDIDESQNRLTVGVLEGTDAAQVENVVERLGVPLDAVAIQTTDPVVPLNTLLDAHDPIGGGLQIWRFDPPFAVICTLGFNVRFTSPSKSQHYFFTNSHCTEERGTVTGTEFRQDALVLPSRIVAVEVEDPPFFTCQYAGFRCRFSDAALSAYLPGMEAELGLIYRTTAVATAGAGPVALDEKGKHLRIAKERAFPIVGDVVDKLGRTTGWTRGEVVATCVDTGVAGSAPPIAMLCQDFAQLVSGGGDSGSPVFQQIAVADESKSVTLFGLLWGGLGTLSVFSAMENIHAEFGDFRVR